MVIDPSVSPPPNAASDGVARLCGASASPLLVLATLGVTVAMGTAVTLLVTKRAHVARVTGFANLALALWLVWIAFNASRECLPIGAMAASLPLVVGVAALATLLFTGRRKNDGPEAESG
jgi:hypothetical protein